MDDSNKITFYASKTVASTQTFTRDTCSSDKWKQKLQFNSENIDIIVMYLI